MITNSHKFVPKSPIDNNSALVLAWCAIGDSLLPAAITGSVTYIRWYHVLSGTNMLTHWGRVTHICVSKPTIIGSYNGLSPSRRQAIIWTNGGILLIRNRGTNFSEILSEIYTFSFKEIHLKMSSGKWRPFCLGRNVLTHGDFRGMGHQWFRLCIAACSAPSHCIDAVLLSFGTLETNFSEIWMKNNDFYSTKYIWNVVCKMSAILSHVASPSPG